MQEFGERSEERLLKSILEVLKDIRHDLEPKLVAIEIRFFGGDMQGPITLTPTTKGTTATVLGFDQTGAPFTGVIPPVTFTPDVTTFCSFSTSGNSDAITGTANGTTNLAASLTTAEGLALSDTTQIITSGFVSAPVLTTVKLDFTTPA
jgi:hypothetical protein